MPRRAAEESWAGYCWAINVVDARPYENLRARFTQVNLAQELQFKLEKKDNRFQDRALRFPAVGDVSIPIGNYPTVQDLPCAAPWGPSAFINKQHKTGPSTYAIEIQSGDVLEIEADSFSLIRRAP